LDSSDRLQRGLRNIVTNHTMWVFMLLVELTTNNVIAESMNDRFDLACTMINGSSLDFLAIRYVLAFSVIIFLEGILCIFPPSCTCIYSGPSPSDEYKCYS
jgi:hypothetical protein